MPTLGGLLKKRRTRGSKGSSKDLGSPPHTASSSQASSALHTSITSPPTSASSPSHAQSQHSPVTTLPPTHTRDTSSTDNAHLTTASSDSQAHTNRANPMSASPSPYPPGVPGDVAQVTLSGHHPHTQNAASIKNIINSPQHENMASQASGDSQQLATQHQHQHHHHHHHHHQHQQHQQQQEEKPAKPVPRQVKGKYNLDDFTLKRTLGTGSFGRVHLVQSTHNHRFYAMKVLKKAQVVKMKQIEHTNDERKMLARVRSPFLVTLWGTFQDAKNLYMVMDFVEGGELFSLLRKSQVREVI